MFFTNISRNHIDECNLNDNCLDVPKCNFILMYLSVGSDF